MKLRILLIDDQSESVEPLHAEIKKLQDMEAIVVGFTQVDEAIKAHAPHIIILDLAQGNPADKDTPGLKTYENIWEKKFCPLVFYTAVPELLGDDERLKHPFIRVEKKGSGSEERVVKHIQEFGPHVSALLEATAEIAWAMNRELRVVATRVFDSVKDEAQRKEMLVRAARRRVAAAMDKKLSTGEPNLKSWEHYLCPPATIEYLLTGDIIRKRAGDPKDPALYAVVLTPTCDLVSGEKRKPKVDKALVATCTNVQRLLEDVGLDVKTKRDKCRERLLPLLTQGHGSSCLPLPSLPGEFPAMAADFRKLELIALNDIGEGEKPYVRVASVDNPFRELVSWAYMTNAARPGLPDRDFESWADEVIAALPELEKKA